MKVDMFLSLDSKRAGKVRGESADGTIKIENFTFGVKTPQASGTVSGRRAYSDVTIFKQLDQSTPLLLSMIATNDQIKSAIISVKKAGGKQELFYQIELRDGHLSSFENVGYSQYTADDGRKSDLSICEEIKINFTVIKAEYFSQKEDGSMGAVITFQDEVRGV
jgi:type VI secretion system secreted protein Hcp